jgi:hypothetical protein
VGEDGFALLDALDADEAEAPLRALPAVQVLRAVWARHDERIAGPVRWRADAELPRAAEGIESPSDPEARYRTKRETHWTGYMVHLTNSPTVSGRYRLEWKSQGEGSGQNLERPREK